MTYIVSPIDLIPDMPIVGWIDDIGVGALFISFCNYRVNNLKSDNSEQRIIDVMPVETNSIETDNNVTPSAPKKNFDFIRKKNI